MYDAFAPKGVKFILLVGQDNVQQPSGFTFAAEYKFSKGYQEGWIAVGDANWTKTETVIANQSDYLPQYIVLDQDLILRHVSADTVSAGNPVTALEEILAVQGIQ